MSAGIEYAVFEEHLTESKVEVGYVVAVFASCHVAVFLSFASRSSCSNAAIVGCQLQLPVAATLTAPHPLLLDLQQHAHEGKQPRGSKFTFHASTHTNDKQEISDSAGLAAKSWSAAPGASGNRGPSAVGSLNT